MDSGQQRRPVNGRMDRSAQLHSVPARPERTVLSPPACRLQMPSLFPSAAALSARCSCVDPSISTSASFVHASPACTACA